MFLKNKIKSIFVVSSVLTIYFVIWGNEQRVKIENYSLSNIENYSLSNNELKYGAWMGSWPSKQGIKQFEELQQRHLDVVNMFVNWSTNFPEIRKNFDAVYDNNSTISLTWEANTISTVDIKNGSADRYIRKMARDLGAYKKPMVIRLFHEGNGNWYSWSIGDSKINTNESYVAAFRHVVDIFREEGATNVKWEFNINVTNEGEGSSYLNHYPGDDYVDIISIDGYNWGGTKGSNDWKSFDKIFTPAYDAVKIQNKPISIAEFSSTEVGGNKALWYTDAFNSIKSQKYKLVDTVVCFNENKESDWRINSTDEALKAYIVAIK